MASKSKSVAIIGLGNFGAMVATELTGFDNDVIGIDKDEKVASAFADKLFQTVIADSRDEEALREAGVADCEVALIAMGEDLEASVVTAINLKVIGIETIWAKAMSRAHHRILSKIGVDRVIRPDEEIGQHIAQMLHNPLVRDYVSLGNGFHVVDLNIPDPFDDKPLADLRLRDFSLRCIGIMRGTEFLGNEQDNPSLKTDDHILLLGKRADLRAFASSFLPAD